MTKFLFVEKKTQDAGNTKEYMTLKKRHDLPPFKKLDTLSTNDQGNRPSNPIINLKINKKDVIAFGIYTLSNDILKLSVQIFPLFPEESRSISFQIKNNLKWIEIIKSQILERFNLI